jgi:hypothetical protein
MKSVILSLAMLLSVAQASDAAASAESPDMRLATERYRTCATLSLPENFAKIGDPRDAAEKALDRCHKKRLALAGQYALDNPGTRRAGDYVDGVRLRLTGDLATWIGDMKTLGVAGPR